jgi:hypothetical protein
MKERVRRVAAAIIWLVLVAAIALGAAGLVVGADHPPGTPARDELTWARDREVEAVLDSAERQLTALGEEVAELGVQARGALASLNGSDTSTAVAAIAEGDRVLGVMRAVTTAVRLQLDGVPYVGRTDAALLLSERTVQRHAALVGVLDTTRGLDADWARLTGGAVAAMRLSTLLATHDQQVAGAAELGRAARYDDAIARLAEADATIVEARALQVKLANTVDVTILREWLDRNADYDVALRGLYAAYAKLGTKVTAELRDAIAAEAAARRNLPPDTRGLVVIMAEIGRGGMTGAVIAIEEARGRLTAAIAGP